MSDRLGFVILHYNAITETINCIRSIENMIDIDNYHIIVVDNCSPNHTGIELKERYALSEKITVICNEENLGFARGNNIGYKYAKEILKCDFICIMNNDTLLIQKDFFRVIKTEYDNSQYGILGPRIILKDESDYHIYAKLPSREFLCEELAIQKRDLFLMTWHLDHFVTAYKLMKNLFFKIIKKPYVSRYRELFLHEGLTERHEDIILHGCCIVFSPTYINEYAEAFHPDTFLYREEELLYLRCKKKQMKVVYNPKLLIKHLEDAATDTVVRKNREKIKFQKRNQVDSIQILLNEMRSMNME